MQRKDPAVSQGLYFFESQNLDSMAHLDSSRRLSNRVIAAQFVSASTTGAPPQINAANLVLINWRCILPPRVRGPDANTVPKSRVYHLRATLRDEGIATALMRSIGVDLKIGR